MGATPCPTHITTEGTSATPPTAAITATTPFEAAQVRPLHTAKAAFIAASKPVVRPKNEGQEGSGSGPVGAVT